MKTRAYILFLAVLFFAATVSPKGIAAAIQNLSALQILRGFRVDSTEFPTLEDGSVIFWPTYDQSIQRLLAYIYLENEQPESALNVMQGPMGNCVDAITCLRQGEALFQLNQRKAAIAKWRNTPNIDIYFAFKGDIAYEKQKTSVALQWYDISWEIAPTLTPQKISMFLNLCRLYRNLDEMEAAIAWCSRATTSNTNYWTLVELGRTLYEAKQYNLAEEALDKAVIIAPNHGSAYQWLGLTLYKRGQKQDAIEMLNTGVQIAPENIWLHLELGNILQLEGAYQSAACEYLKARDLTERESLLVVINERIRSLSLTQEELLTECGASER